VEADYSLPREEVEHITIESLKYTLVQDGFQEVDIGDSAGYSLWQKEHIRVRVPEKNTLATHSMIVEAIEGVSIITGRNPYAIMLQIETMSLMNFESKPEVKESGLTDINNILRSLVSAIITTSILPQAQVPKTVDHAAGFRVRHDGTILADAKKLKEHLNSSTGYVVIPRYIMTLATTLASNIDYQNKKESPIISSGSINFAKQILQFKRENPDP
jgi:hypothetical protein